MDTNQHNKEDKSKKFNIIQPLLFSAFISVGMMVGYKMNDRPQNSLLATTEMDAKSMMNKNGRIEELIQFIESKYVDSIITSDLVDEAIIGIFKKLDPHSLYLAPQEVIEMNDEMNGSYLGIGIQQFKSKDTSYIIDVLENSPAQKAGLMVFDKIISINDSLFSGNGMEIKKLNFAFTTLSKGDNARIKIIRDYKPMTIDVIVDDVMSSSVNSTYMKDIKTIIVKIQRFDAKTYQDFMKEIEKYAADNKPHNLILDLRDNPGGYLPEAINILCQIFEEKDKILVYTIGKDNKRNDYKTSGKRFFNLDQIVVLIDEGSASASEIIAGAIQDWDRGVLVGRRSYGKGLVQEQYDLQNGGAIRLTVARYYTPSGRSIQRSYQDKDRYENDYYDRLSHGDLFNKDSVLTTSKEETFYTLNLKRKVKSLGGVTPDIFVSKDTILASEPYLYATVDTEVYTIDYAIQHRKSMPTTYQGIKFWNIPDDFYTGLLATIGKIYPKSSFTLQTLKKFEPIIKNSLMGLMLDKATYKELQLKEDLFILKAKESILNNNKIIARKKIIQ